MKTLAAALRKHPDNVPSGLVAVDGWAGVAATASTVVEVSDDVGAVL